MSLSSFNNEPTHEIRRHCFLLLGMIFATSGLAQINSSVPLPIPPGLEYSHSRIGTGPFSIHLLKIDRTKPQFKFATSLAQNTILGLQPLSQQVKAISQAGHKPVAAVNGDFFRIRSGPYQGDPLGLQILNGELISSPGRVCFWLDTQQRPHIATIQADFQATWPDGTSIPFDINQELKKGHAVLYTPCMGQSTRTESGVELVLEAVPESPWLPIKPGQIYQSRIHAVNQDANSVITSDKLILSLSPSVVNTLKKLTVGTILSLSVETAPDLTHVETAISGGPLLVTNGTKQTFSPNQPRHPRTAIGWNKAQYFLMVVDGRQEGLSVGMTLPELADMMLTVGCTDALNLDGGGSSTLWLAGSIMNSPSDRQERRIANGLVLLQDL
jgi:hypothetical protein